MPPLEVKDLTRLIPPSTSTADSKRVPRVLCRWYRSQKGQYEDKATALNPPLLQDFAAPAYHFPDRMETGPHPHPYPHHQKKNQAQSRTRWEVKSSNRASSAWRAPQSGLNHRPVPCCWPARSQTEESRPRFITLFGTCKSVWGFAVLLLTTTVP